MITEQSENTNISIYDMIIMVLYLLVLLVIGLGSSVIRFVKKYILKRQEKEQNTEDYFLASRSVGWWAIGASLFCSNIGAEHFIGLAGTGASEGIAVGYYELSGALILLLLGYIFVPVYLKSKIFTTPEFVEIRFSKHIRTYLAILSLVIYILTKISVTLFAAGIVFEVILGWNIYVSSLVLFAVTGVYTVAGGLSAVIYTEVLQSFVLIIGTAILTVLAYIKVGGLGSIMAAKPDHFHFVKPLSDPEFPWIGLFIGIPINGIWYWCADQVIVQRVLASKSNAQAEVGCTLAGFLKLTTLFSLIIPGIISSYLFPEEVGKNSNKAFTLLVVRLMPVALKGVLISAMLSAAMSSLASIFNSASTIFTMDVYKRMRNNAGERELVIVGKCATAFLIVLSILWVPFIPLISDQLYIYIQSVSSYTAPPVAALFLGAILSKRITSSGALVSLVGGFILGMTRFVIEILYKRSTKGTENLFFFVFAQMNYLYFAIILFCFSSCLLLVTSLFTPMPADDKVADCTINWIEFVKEWKMRIICWKSNYLLLSGTSNQYQEEEGEGSEEADDSEIDTFKDIEQQRRIEPSNKDIIDLRVIHIKKPKFENSFLSKINFRFLSIFFSSILIASVATIVVYFR